MGFFNHSFNYSTCDWPAHISHFFLFQSPHVGQNGHHQNSLQTVNAGEGVERRKRSNTVGGNVNGTTAREGLKKKLKIESPHDPIISLLGMYLQKNVIPKVTWTPTFTAVLFTIATTGKQPKCH